MKKQVLLTEVRGEGIIELDSEFAKKIGFTSDKFDGHLWNEAPDYIVISFIVSKDPRKGNLRKLFDSIEALGYGILVPTPSDQMYAICKKRGMQYGLLAGLGDDTFGDPFGFWSKPIKATEKGDSMVSLNSRS